MLYSRRMRLPSIAVAALLWLSCLLSISPAQTPAPGAPEDYSGMYSFVKDGEFMQITEEDKGAVSGFISRYGDSENDKGAFIDQFVKSGSWTSKQLSFTTEKVHGIVYGFDGALEAVRRGVLHPPWDVDPQRYLRGWQEHFHAEPPGRISLFSAGRRSAQIVSRRAPASGDAARE